MQNGNDDNLVWIFDHPITGGFFIVKNVMIDNMNCGWKLKMKNNDNSQSHMI